MQLQAKQTFFFFFFNYGFAKVSSVTTTATPGLTLTHVRLVQQFPHGPVITVHASVAVDARREVPTVLTHAASLASAVDVDGQVRRVRRVVVRASLRMTETVAGYACSSWKNKPARKRTCGTWGSSLIIICPATFTLRTRLTFTLEQFVVFRLAPGFLLETRTTSFAVVTASVVLTAAYELVRVRRIGYVAQIRVTVATASAADAHVFYRVKILKRTKNTAAHVV